MPISRELRGCSGTIQSVVDLCRGAWTELGVSGWGRTHQHWAIDPEPLIVFTAVIGREDPRLRDEALDWCIRHSRHVSQARLRNIIGRRADADLAAWGEFAATVNSNGNTHWPGATSARSTYERTGRSTLRSLSEPSLVFLRMRAMFGLGARTEILRCLRFGSATRATAAELAEQTNYAKRNVSEECDLLVAAGVLTVKTISNRFSYSLANASTLAAFVGPVPPIVPDWNALWRIARAVHSIAQASEELSPDALAVETHQALRQIGGDLETLGIRAPRRVPGPAFIDVWKQWAASTFVDLAAGQWPGPGSDQDRREILA